MTVIEDCTIELRAIADALDPDALDPFAEVCISAHLAARIATYLRVTADMHDALFVTLKKTPPPGAEVITTVECMHCGKDQSLFSICDANFCPVRNTTNTR